MIIDSVKTSYTYTYIYIYIYVCVCVCVSVTILHGLLRMDTPLLVDQQNLVRTLDAI